MKRDRTILISAFQIALSISGILEYWVVGRATGQSEDYARVLPLTLA